MHEGSRKAVIAALAANIGIALSKFVGFFFTGAASMLAEAVHSLADCGNQGLLIFGGASELWLLGASETRLGGSSELMFAGSSELRMRGASERMFAGATEQLFRGSSERILGGASEQMLAGASERRLGGGSENALGASERMFGASERLGALPCGLGARDTLRTEMGYPLHGHELSLDVTPVQAGLNWAVGWDKPQFWGRARLTAERAEGPRRRLRGLLATDRNIPRADAGKQQE